MRLTVRSKSSDLLARLYNAAGGAYVKAGVVVRPLTVFIGEGAPLAARLVYAVVSGLWKGGCLGPGPRSPDAFEAEVLRVFGELPDEAVFEGWGALCTYRRGAGLSAHGRAWAPSPPVAYLPAARMGVYACSRFCGAPPTAEGDFLRLLESAPRHAEPPGGLPPALAPLWELVRVLQRGALVVVEEPEAHLHPAMQVRAADLIADLAAEGVYFIVATHSDYVLNRISNVIRRAEGRLKRDMVSAYVFKRRGGGFVAQRLKIGRGGIPDDEFAKVYEELYREHIDLLYRR
jgi:hypothetical protein